MNSKSATNLKRGFLRAWIVLTAVWFVAAYFIVSTMTHQSDPSAYFYNQIECRFEGVHSYDSRLKNLRKCVSTNQAIEVILPDGTTIFGDPRQTISVEQRVLLWAREKRGTLPPRLRKCIGEAKRRGIFETSKLRALTSCEERVSPTPKGFQLVDPGKDGFWHRVDVTVSAEDRENLRENILADFERHQSKKSWERLKIGAFLFAGIGLAPPVAVLFFGLMVGWVVRGFRNQ